MTQADRLPVWRAYFWVLAAFYLPKAFGFVSSDPDTRGDWLGIWPFLPGDVITY